MQALFIPLLLSASVSQSSELGEMGQVGFLLQMCFA